MNSSKFLDKEITRLSKSHPSIFLDDDEEEDDHGGGGGARGGDYSFDFHRIHSAQSGNKDFRGTHARGWSCMDHNDSSNFSSGNLVTLVSDIDRKMKEHTDILLHSIKGLSARVLQMESRTVLLENAVEDLKDVIEFYHGKTERKQRDLESILTEVQVDINDLKDKQEIAEAKLRLTKLLLCKDDPQSEKQSSADQARSGVGSSSSGPQQPFQPLLIPVSCPKPLAISSDIMNPPLQYHLETAPQTTTAAIPPAVNYIPTPTPVSSHLPQSMIPSLPKQESYNPMSVQTSEAMHQLYYVPPFQQSQSSPHTHQHYLSPPHLPPNSLSSHMPPVTPTSTAVNPTGYGQLNPHPEGNTLISPYSSLQFSQSPGWSYAPQQLIADTMHKVLDPPSWRCSSEPTSLSSQARGPQLQQPVYATDHSHYDASPNHHSISATKRLEPLSSPPGSRDGSSYVKLPTAKTIPHAIPTASIVDNESDSSGSGNSVSVDDVIDKVVAMGFRRDLVRATMKKLTDNGQTADLNTVLDNLTNKE
uniref:Uncharacterized protein LOC8278314 n=1 Tax=Rhizophora mucronata TaxID=61149 RepID=A0A2P2Q3F7_RHIMU